MFLAGPHSDLCTTDAESYAVALELYEKRQRLRAELLQKNSRNLARMMFINSVPMAWACDRMMRFYTLNRLVRDISQVMEGY